MLIQKVTADCVAVYFFDSSISRLCGLGMISIQALQCLGLLLSNLNVLSESIVCLGG